MFALFVIGLLSFRRNKEILFFSIQGESSNRTFICATKENHWTEGPSLLTKRYCHSSCAIRSDDGSIQYIIIIGGWTNEEELYSETTEILSIKDQKWIKGPNLPRGIGKSACVSFLLQLILHVLLFLLCGYDLF